jgi:uncharacterized protein
MAASTFSPLAQQDRILSIDILRGVAVLGILVMNIQHFSMPQAAYINPAAYGDLNGLNRWVWIISHVLASEKFMSIFSMLFGASLLLFTRRAEDKGRNSALLHYRRMFWLLFFGLMHAYLLWSGDILVSYSICGMLVYLFRNKSPSALLVIAFAFFVVPLLISLFFVWSIPYWPEENMQFTLDSWQPGMETIQHQLGVFRGGWRDQMELRVPGSMFMQTGYFLMESFWQVTALMLTGMALLKWNILTGERSARFYLKLAMIGLASGYLLSGLGVYLNFRREWAMEFSMFLGSQFNYVGSVGVALGYTALIMLFSKSAACPGIKNIFASVGRMAFSNYILMTLLGTFIFYGFGLGLFGSVERKYQVLLVVAIWIPILIISPLWFKRFRFGPLERVWRALTYWQPKNFISS